MEPISLSDAAEAMRARAIGDFSGEAARICTDTRAEVHRSLFFALMGESADGHHYVRQAFEKGAAGAVVQRFVEIAGLPQLIVADTLIALGDLAAFYRQRFDLSVVGITGSVGKTSTKEMVAHALRSRLNVLMSEKNFNNEIGVPHTLFQLNESHQASVIEMGMRGKGQIARLAQIARPQVGVITNVGLSHVELLGSREEIASAKAELLQSLPEDGTAVINAGDDYAPYLSQQTRARVLTFGTAKGADFRATHVRFDEQGEPRFRVNGVSFAVRAAGAHHVLNAAAACAVASHFEIAPAEVAAQMESYRPPPMRMETVQLPNGITILNDAYNAAPDSMRSALETLSHMAGTRRRAVAILGDMKELGPAAESAHRYVGEQAASRRIDLLITVGELARWIADSAARKLGKKRVKSFDSTESALEGLDGLIRLEDLVLVKGSRAMAMERIVEAIREENERRKTKG